MPNPRGPQRNLDLFIELGASEEQADFPLSMPRRRLVKRLTQEVGPDLQPLFDVILEKFCSEGGP